MDADIADILASVSAPAIPPRALDLQALTRAWINERSCPDLLPYPTDLIQRCTDAVRGQIDVIEEKTGAMDPASNFTLVILQTELERIKFLIRSYLRARIAKVCNTGQQHRHAIANTVRPDRQTPHPLPPTRPRRRPRFPNPLKPRIAIPHRPPGPPLLPLLRLLPLPLPQRSTETGRHGRRHQYDRQTRRGQRSLLPRATR